MKKYDAYDNELTRYIDIITDISIKDIIGDIVGDILDVDIPINIPEGDTTINGITTMGSLEINITKNITKKGFKKSTKTNITIGLQKGDSIYEEYIFDLDEKTTNIKVEGFIIEERERGIIITRNLREYDLNYNTFILINMQEKRNDYPYQQLEDAYINMNVDGKEPTLKDKNHFIKCVFGYPIEYIIAIGGGTNLNIGFPNYNKDEYWLDNKPFRININNFPKEHLYKSLEGQRLLERVDDLIHGNITQQSLIDLKTLLNDSSVEFGTPISGFNLLTKVKATNDKGKVYDTLESLEEEQLGPSKNTLSREYYEYLRDLVQSTFQVEISEDLDSSSDIVQLLKSNNEKK